MIPVGGRRLGCTAATCGLLRLRSRRQCWAPKHCAYRAADRLLTGMWWQLRLRQPSLDHREKCHGDGVVPVWQALLDVTVWRTRPWWWRLAASLVVKRLRR